MRLGKAGLTAALTIGCLAPAGSVAAQDSSPWQMRIRGLAVVPDEEATITPVGGTVEVSTTYVPELDITYFFHPHVAVELILATTKHDVTAVGTTVGDVDAGSVWLLPPTLTLQYHPLAEGMVRPYIGAGVNFTVFYNEETPGGVITEASYDNAFGFALQAGIDLALGDYGRWLVNADLKKIFLSTDATFNDNTIQADVTLDPWLFGLGVGYRFGR